MKTIKPPVAKHRELIRDIVNRRAGVVVYPTETYYALGCAANSGPAVSAIYKLKKRDKRQPLLTLVNSWKMLEYYATEISEKKRRILKKFWPGPLTVILKAKNKLAKELNFESDTLAFRITSSAIAQELIDICGLPLVGTSANLSGRAEVVSCPQARGIFGDRVDLYVDGGLATAERPSTLVDMTEQDNYVCVRRGAIPQSIVERYFGNSKLSSNLRKGFREKRKINASF